MLPSNPQFLSAIPHTAAPSERAVSDLDYLSLLQAHRRALSPDEAEALRMAEVQGARYTDIAAALDLPEDIVSSLIFQARHKLVVRMEQCVSDLSI